ncbi:MAG: DUF4783 domain-containing protein [Bacteroidales bacterium]
MLTKRLLLGVIFSTLFIINNSKAQTPAEIQQVYESLLNGQKLEALSGHFNAIIELRTPGKDGNFSKKQARLILTDFFKANPCKNYSIHRNGSFPDNSRFFLGEMKSEAGNTYRVYIVSRKQSGKWLIHILKIQKT